MFFITVIPFFKKSGIGKSALILLFFIKICAGVAYAKFYTLPKNYIGSDTWRFYRLSLAETQWLFRSPATFLEDIFINNYNTSGNLFSGKDTYWNDLKSTVVIKLMAVINVFTNNSYYADIIFFNFLFLFGLAALFRLFIQIFPNKKWLILAGVFLLPSTLFWCSGIHKDGLILSAAGLVIYFFNEGFKKNFTAGSAVVILVSLLLIFSLRNSVFFALLPALIAWSLCEKYRGKNFKIFFFVYTAAIVFFLVIPFVLPSANIFLFITNKRQEFLLLEGGSKVNLPFLKPAFKSFVSFIPYAADMAFLRPNFTEIKNISYLPAVIENIIFLLLTGISIVRLKKEVKTEPVILFLFFFSVSIMFLSAYTIPFTGAMVRYKSIVLPLLITPLLCTFDLIVVKSSFKDFFG